MQPDTHGDAILGAYRIHTLYLDTPERDVYLRSPGYRVSKFRVRQYGKSLTIFVEQKRKRGTRVLKQRTLIDRECLPELARDAALAEAPQDWFKIKVSEHNLAPVSRVSYTRNAFNAPSEEGTVRLTLDHDLHVVAEQCWKTGEALNGIRLIPDQCIVEIKFPEMIPALFKDLVVEFGLLRTGMSKYRLAHEALLEDFLVEERCKNY